MNRKRTMLVVEDNAELSEEICDYLHIIRPNWTVVTATNGQDGLELAQATKPDVILRDLHMPLMNGYQMTMHLRQEPTTSHIPIILYTSADINQELTKDVIALWSEVIAKFQIIRLLDAVLQRILPDADP